MGVEEEKDLLEKDVDEDWWYVGLICNGRGKMEFNVMKYEKNHKGI